MNPKCFNLLGLAMRAGKLVSGEETVIKTIRSGKAALVIFTEDASQGTKKKITDKCSSYKVPFYEIMQRGELGHAIGKAERVVIALTDTGFAGQVKRLLDE